MYQDQPEISNLEDVLKKRNRQCHGTNRGVAANKKDSIFLRKSEHSSDQGAFTINLAISNSKFRYVFTGKVPKGWKLLAAFYFSIRAEITKKMCTICLLLPTILRQIFDTLDAIWQLLIFLHEMF